MEAAIEKIIADIKAKGTIEIVSTSSIQRSLDEYISQTEIRGVVLHWPSELMIEMSYLGYAYFLPSINGRYIHIKNKKLSIDVDSYKVEELYWGTLLRIWVKDFEILD